MHGTAAEADVTGAAFLGLIRHVKDSAGADALADIVDEAGPRTKEIFTRPIRVMAWYPYSAYTSFLTAIDAKLGQSDLAYCRSLGEFAGKRDLGTIFKIYVALSSPERLIRSCAKVWSSYHRNAGDMRALSWGPEETVLRIEGFPSMHKGHCLLMEGWMMKTMDTIGCRVLPGARETTCMSDGGAFHEFRCEWQSKSR
jgi:hypothetical protein